MLPSVRKVMNEAVTPLSEPRKRQRTPLWVVTYALLAAFNFLTLAGALYLNHAVTDVYKRTVSASTLWAAKEIELVSILDKTENANAPANDIFVSRDAALEKTRFDTAATALVSALTAFENRLKQEDLPQEAKTNILSELGSARAEIDRLAGASRSVFSAFDAGDEGAAARHMAATDAAAKKVFTHVRLGLDIVQAQKARLLQAETARMEALRSAELVFVALVFVLVAGMSYYGLRLLRRLRERETERKGLLDSAEEDKAKLASILDTAGDAIITIDREGRIMSFNTAAEWIFGYPETEVKGQNVSILMPNPHRERHDGYIRNYLETGKGEIINTSREEYALHKNGTNFPIDLSVTEVKLPNGERIFTAFIRDITDRKKSEVRIQKYTEELEQQALQLDVAKGLAEKATRLKSEFLANMSHEIRTPMNGVIGMATLMAETQLDQKQRHYLDTIRGSAENLLQIINDILDFSKIEAGKIELAPVPLDMRTLVAEATDLVASANREGDVSIIFSYAPEAPRYVMGDPVRIRQILINLVGNARKFTQSGSIRTEVEGETMSDGRARLRFKVVDTGIGIPADKLDYIFDKFSQADTSTTRKFGGTGLGLAICRKLVEMMGGKIFATSVMGQGSTFHFTLLLDACTDEASLKDLQADMPVSHRKSSEKPHYAGVDVLLVEDNPVNREVAATMLSEYGCTVDEAENGAIAVEKISVKKYDLVFMDLQMPELDGLEATQAIRRKGIITPIVAFTANAMKGDDEKCLAAGMNDYMSKPVQVAVLESMLRKWLPAERMVAYKSITQATQNAMQNDYSGAVDRATFDRLKTMMDERFPILLEKYLKSAGGYIEGAKAALAANDAKKLAESVHPLKSSAASMGFVKVSELARNIEAAARDMQKSGENVVSLAGQVADLETAGAEISAFIASLG